jgi:hypothetical protein
MSHMASAGEMRPTLALPLLFCEPNAGPGTGRAAKKFAPLHLSNPSNCDGWTIAL